MRGKQNGVQAKILHLNSRAFYVPCSSHSLNLIVNDAIGSCFGKVTFFDIVQHLFVFLSSSTQRWNVLRQFVKGLTLKALCETRWASRIGALKPLRHQLREIIQALESFWNIELHVSPVTATKNKSESRAVLQKIDFKFVCCLHLV